MEPLEIDMDFSLVVCLNERTMVVIREPNDNLLLFARDKSYLLEGKECPSPWGFATHAVTNIKDCEFEELVLLYTKDLENKNFWWEIE